MTTDGDFNLGITDPKDIEALVKKEREKGITLSTLGVGDDNFNEAMMVRIADVGNGNYSYIDSLSEAQKVLKDEMHQTLVTVAKDVKSQIEFNPQWVTEYRQIGMKNANCATRISITIRLMPVISARVNTSRYSLN